MDTPSKEVEETEDTLAEVASLIQPLPDNVIPSDEFLKRTRKRLLQLQGKRKPADQPAA